MYSKRLQTGIAGEFLVYSKLIQMGKNCFITLGNAKSIDIILINNKKAFMIDVKTSNTLMNNTHKHPCENLQSKITRWQVAIKPFYEYYINKRYNSFPDIYIFCSLKKQDVYILTAKEMINLMTNRIKDEISKNNGKTLKENQICNWEICELCFNPKNKNNWDIINNITK